MSSPMQLVNLQQRAHELSGVYENVAVATINDHVVRLSMMTEPFFWHSHPNSDELFVGVAGIVLLELEGRSIELKPGDMFCVPKGVKHRTSPLGARSVNLTVERAEMLTVPE